MILAEDLSKKYDSNLAVDGICMDVRPGQILVLLGPNGAGKTTTIRMLSSTLIPTRGRAVVGGFDVVRQPEKVRGAVGVLTEHHGLYGRMNAVEYLEFFGRLYGMKAAEARERTGFLLEAFGLVEHRAKRLSEYSRGMRQKLALSRVLLHDPPVLLLDEPTSAMDPDSARAVRDAIHILRAAQRTIILCTHNLAEAEKLADQVAILRRGKIIFSGTKADLAAQFLGPQEFDAHFDQPVQGKMENLPDGVSVTTWGDRWVRFQVEQPPETNPGLMRHLLDRQMKLISFQPVPRDLEKAYLAAVNRKEVDHG